MQFGSKKKHRWEDILKQDIPWLQYKVYTLSLTSKDLA